MRVVWGLLLIAFGLGAVLNNKHRTRQRTSFDRLLFGSRSNAGPPSPFVRAWGRTVAVLCGSLLTVCGLLVLAGVIDPSR